MPFSYIGYTGDGSQKDYTFPFPYLDSEDISVTVNAVPVPFTFIHSSAIRCTTAPPANSRVIVRRVTQKVSAPVNFTDGSVLLEKDLDTLVLYTQYIAQEQADSTEDAVEAYGSVPEVLELIEAAKVSIDTGVISAEESKTLAALSALSAADSATIAVNSSSTLEVSASIAQTQAALAVTKATEAAASAGLAYNYAQLAYINDYGLLTGTETVNDYGNI